jgi:DNA polymerase-3 subunit delta'
VEFPIDVVREFVIDKVSSKPTVSQRRVFVLSETEKLNPSSQNALLKVLEEPPDYCHIILLCTRLDRLLATTKSRAHTVRFGPVEEERIVASLETIGLGKREALYLARLSQGSLGTAMQWGELEAAGAGLWATGCEIAASLATAEYGDSVELAERFLSYAKKVGTAWGKMDSATSKTDLNRRALKTVVEMIISVLHDAMIMEAGADGELVNCERRKEVGVLARRLGTEGAAERIAECYRTEQWIEASVNEKLNFEQLLLSLCDSGTMQV